MKAAFTPAANFSHGLTQPWHISDVIHMVSCRQAKGCLQVYSYWNEMVLRTELLHSGLLLLWLWYVKLLGKDAPVFLIIDGGVKGCEVSQGMNPYMTCAY